MLSLFINLISGLSDQVKMGGLLIIAVIMAMLTGATYYYKSSYEDELKSKASLETRYSQISDELTVCNNNIQSLSDRSKKKLDEAQAAIDKAKEDGKKYQSKAQNLLSTPAISKDSCVSSKQLMTDYLSGLKVTQ